ncbi:hypothetical protein G6011_10762 [Alternaria panax]|uniref:Uncharacterized protein n=1 Tax=Alternaria panax TaxID=48097 RepID=A0AAD4ICH3_9PLEO|nr:hypothetical protein G6011_10762 [Alternaria panax]
MARGQAVPEKKHEGPRLDSGAALSDPNTDWDYGTPKAHYRKNELKLLQPKGFPIKPLTATLIRARKEAELETAAKRYSDTDFEIYEDFEGDDKVEEGYEDEEEEDVAENVADNSADGSADNSDASTELTVSTFITEKPAALVDSRGRTRAATTRRKAQEASDPTMSTDFLREAKADATIDSKKRKHRSTQACKQPTKTLPKKVV